MRTLALAILLTGCASEPGVVRIPPAPLMPSPDAATMQAEALDTPSPDREFAKLASEFLARYLELNPVTATQLGDHRFDARWPQVGPEAEKQLRDFVGSTRSRLDAIAADKLDSSNRIDAAILRNQLELWSFWLDELRDWENDPMFYTGLIGDGLDPLVTREFAPAHQRLTSLGARLGAIPQLVEAARKNLKRPPKLNTETAIQQNAGLIALVDKELAGHFSKAPELQADLEKRRAIASKALHELGDFLKDELLKRSDGTSRLGKARFDKKLRLVLESDMPPDQLYAAAQELFDKTQEQMVETSLALWPELFAKGKPPAHADHKGKLKVVRSVLEALAKDRSTNATIVQDASKILQESTDFVRAKNLVEVPTEPVRVIEMPEYRRGVAIAYCDSSGPFEKNAMTFFAISPTPADWSKKRAESFYREYNRSMLVDLTVHEAMPGHYVQLMHANRFKSDIRAAFGSGAFIEGWATYAEWLMSKHGFGGLRTRLQMQKMDLRMAANAMIDHDVHAGQMAEKDAMRLMTEEAFQEEGEAAAKWKRAQLTSAQLSTYLYGYTSMMRLRERAEKQPAFSERSYHDKLLSFGSPAPRYLGHLMFGDSL